MHPRGAQSCGVNSIATRSCVGRLSTARSFVKHARPAFSLIDVLVTLLVITLLLGIMLPSMNQARETARRVVCASNVRQIGLAVAMYADDSKNHIPYTIFAPPGAKPEELELADTVIVRFNAARFDEDEELRFQWDGLGLLYLGEYLAAPQAFYCPSHSGDHPFTAYSRMWKGEDGEIVSNYQYRGLGPNGATRLFQIEPARSAIAADGLRTQADFNHTLGLNVLRADLAIVWFSDAGRQIYNQLPMSEDSHGSSAAMGNIWTQIDHQTTSSPDGPS